MGGNEDAIEEIEFNMFKCLKTKVDRFYVNIRNNSLKIWTVSANTKSNKVRIKYFQIVQEFLRHDTDQSICEWLLYLLLSRLGLINL